MRWEARFDRDLFAIIPTLVIDWYGKGLVFHFGPLLIGVQFLKRKKKGETKED